MEPIELMSGEMDIKLTRRKLSRYVNKFQRNDKISSRYLQSIGHDLSRPGKMTKALALLLLNSEWFDPKFIITSE